MRNRSTKATLASLVLVFESVVVFFATLVAFGLKVYPDPAVIWLVGLGISVLLMISPAFMGRPGSYELGWIMQFVVLALGIWVPLMYLLGVVFLGMWIWGMIAGTTIDKAKAALEKQRLLGEAKESE